MISRAAVSNGLVVVFLSISLPCVAQWQFSQEYQPLSGYTFGENENFYGCTFIHSPGGCHGVVWVMPCGAPYGEYWYQGWSGLSSWTKRWKWVHDYLPPTFCSFHGKLKIEHQVLVDCDSTHQSGSLEGFTYTRHASNVTVSASLDDNDFKSNLNTEWLAGHTEGDTSITGDDPTLWNDSTYDWTLDTQTDRWGLDFTGDSKITETWEGNLSGFPDTTEVYISVNTNVGWSGPAALFASGTKYSFLASSAVAFDITDFSLTMN